MSGATTAAVIGGTAALGGAAISASAAKSGAKAQASALQGAEATQAQSLQDQLALQQRALDQQQAQYTTNMAVEQPFVDAGKADLTEFNSMLNGTGAQQEAALSATPGYKFQLDQGTAAMERGAASTTGVLSSAEQQNLMTFGQGLAGTTYNNFMDRLQSGAALGQNAASGQVASGDANSTAKAGILNNMAGATANTGNNTSQLQAGVGAAKASGLNGVGAAASGLGNNLSTLAMLGGGGALSGSGGGNLLSGTFEPGGFTDVSAAGDTSGIVPSNTFINF